MIQERAATARLAAIPEGCAEPTLRTLSGSVDVAPKGATCCSEEMDFFAPMRSPSVVLPCARIPTGLRLDGRGRRCGFVIVCRLSSRASAGILHTSTHVDSPQGPLLRPLNTHLIALPAYLRRLPHVWTRWNGSGRVAGPRCVAVWEETSRNRQIARANRRLLPAGFGRRGRRITAGRRRCRRPEPPPPRFEGPRDEAASPAI